MEKCILNIREFKNDDMENILIIEEKSFTEKQRYDIRIFERLFRKNPELFLVADICGKVVGYVIASYIEDFGHIVSIAVHPDYRNRGIGSKLLEAIEKKLISRGIRIITLEVSINNKTAIKMYRKHGYKSVKKLRNYYGNEDALLMVKYIDSL